MSQSGSKDRINYLKSLTTNAFVRTSVLFPLHRTGVPLHYQERGSRVVADSSLGLFLELEERIPSTVEIKEPKKNFPEPPAKHRHARSILVLYPWLLLLPMLVPLSLRTLLHDYNGLKKANSY